MGWGLPACPAWRCSAALGCCSCRASFLHRRLGSSRLPLPGQLPAASRYLILGDCAMARRGSLAQPVPYEPPGRQSPPAPPGEELKAQPGGPARAQLPCTMPKASSALLLAGLLVLWAELLPASGPNVTSEYERTAPRQQPASLLARGLLGMGSRHTFRSVAVLCSIPEPTPGLGTASPASRRPSHPHRVPLPFSKSRRVPGASSRRSELHDGVPVRWRLREHPQVLPGSLWQGLPGAQR